VIHCQYAVPVWILPGVEPRLRFRLRVERPHLTPEMTIFLGDPGP